MRIQNNTLKKGILVTMATVMAFSIIGCGDSTSSSSLDSSSSSISESITTDSSQEVDTPEQEGEYFANNELVTEDFKLVIKEHKVIQPGETGNEYGKNPVIAFWYDVTNLKSDETIMGNVSWIGYFSVIQDNDPNVVNKLSIALSPDSDLSKNDLEQIKPGGTLSHAIAYELTDTTTPVLLKANAFGFNELGEQLFEIA